MQVFNCEIKRLRERSRGDLLVHYKLYARQVYVGTYLASYIIACRYFVKRSSLGPPSYNSSKMTSLQVNLFTRRVRDLNRDVIASRHNHSWILLLSSCCGCHNAIFIEILLASVEKLCFVVNLTRQVASEWIILIVCLGQVYLPNPYLAPRELYLQLPRHRCSALLQADDVDANPNQNQPPLQNRVIFRVPYRNQ